MRTVYIGHNKRLVREVQAELESLRCRGRLPRRAEQLAEAARRALRAAKQRVAGTLQELGYHYHGDVIRKTRIVNNDIN